MATASVVICAEIATNPAAVPGAPCGEGQGLVTTQSMLVAPGQSAYDEVQAGGFFFFGFGVVVFAYLCGFVVSAVRKPIRRGGS